MTMKWKVALVLLSIVCCETTVLEVHLRVPHYVLLNRNATLKCEYNVPFNHIHKVEWLKGDRKLFQYVKDRNPPFYNYTIPGGRISWSQTNGSQLTLHHLGFSATGVYSCSVTLETPIYTKMSEERHLLVVQFQTKNPKISFRKKKYFVGEWLEANCTSDKARPVPELTWLLNGTEVQEYFIRSFPEQSSYASTIQIAFQIKEDHNSGFNLTCLSTIPIHGFTGKYFSRKAYVDHRSNSILIDVLDTEIYSNSSYDERLRKNIIIFLLIKTIHLAFCT